MPADSHISHINRLRLCPNRISHVHNNRDEECELNILGEKIFKMCGQKCRGNTAKHSYHEPGEAMFDEKYFFFFGIILKKFFLFLSHTLFVPHLPLRWELPYNEEMSVRHIFLLIGLFFLVQFVIFSYLVHKDLFTTMDFNTTVRLQDKMSERVINEFSVLSDVGKFEVVSIVLLAIFVFAKRIRAGIAAAVFYFGLHMVEIFGKFFVAHPPPPEFMLKTEQMLNLPQFHVRSEFSYPSGHSARALFLAVILLTLLWQTKRFSMPIKLGLTALIVGYVGFMLVSRVYLGEHWTTDVIGGTILGLACGFGAAMFLVHHNAKSNKHALPKFKIEVKRVE